VTAEARRPNSAAAEERGCRRARLPKNVTGAEGERRERRDAVPPLQSFFLQSIFLQSIFLQSIFLQFGLPGNTNP
jgi:hypothetical protein